MARRERSVASKIGWVWRDKGVGRGQWWRAAFGIGRSSFIFGAFAEGLSGGGGNFGFPAGAISEMAPELCVSGG